MYHRCFSFGKLSFRTGKHKNNLSVDGEQLYQIWKLHCVSTYGVCIQAHVRNDSSQDYSYSSIFQNERERLAFIIINWIGIKFEKNLWYNRLDSWRHFWSNSSKKFEFQNDCETICFWGLFNEDKNISIKSWNKLPGNRSMKYFGSLQSWLAYDDLSLALYV